MDSNSAPQLNTLLQQQIEISGRFLDLILQERTFLAENRIDEFTQLTPNKLGIIDELTKKDIEIMALLQQIGAENPTQHNSDLLKSLDPDNQFQLQSLWDAVKLTAEKCQRENQINAKIVDTCQAQTEQVLDILLGRNSKDQTYEASGKTSRQTGSTIAKA